MAIRHWRFAAWIVVAALASAAAQAWAQPRSYTAHMTLLVSPDPGATSRQVLAQLNVLSQRGDAFGYERLLSSAAVRREALTRLGYPPDADEDVFRLDSALVPGSLVVAVTAETPDPELSARLANLAGQLGITDVREAFPDIRLAPLSPATPALAPSRPDIPRKLAFGGALGAMVGLSAAYLWGLAAASLAGASRRLRVAVTAAVLVAGTAAGLGAGYAATLEGVSPLKVAAMIVGAAAFPFLVLHLDFGGAVFLGLLWARVSDVAVDYYGAPSIALPLSLALLASALLRLGLRGQLRSAGWTRRELLAILPYVLVTLLSFVWAEWADRALARADILLRDVLVFAILATVLRQPRSLVVACVALVLSAAAMSLPSLHQYATGNFESTYGGFALTEVLNIVAEVDSQRVGGPMGSPNVLGMVLAVVVPIGVALLRMRLPVAVRALIALALPVIILTLLLTYSRTAMLVLGLVVMLSALQLRLRAAHALVAVLAAVVVAAAAPPRVLDRLGTLTNPMAEEGLAGDVSTQLRLGAQAAAAEMFLDHPVLGAGAGNYAPLYGQYTRRLGVVAVGGEYSPHNLYLALLAEIGVVGLLMFLAVVLVPWARLRHARSRLPRVGAGADMRILLSGIEIALAGYMAGSFLLHAAYDRYFWLLLALVVVAGRVSMPAEAVRPAAAPSGARGTLPRVRALIPARAA